MTDYDDDAADPGAADPMDGDVPHTERRRCGARTRSGGVVTDRPCRKFPVPGHRRCGNHGGESLAGPAHPNFKTGRYSKFLPDNMLGSYRAAMTDPDLLQLGDEIAVTTSMLAQAIRRMRPDAGAPAWPDLKREHERLRDALVARDEDAIREAAVALGKTIAAGADDEAARAEILALVALRARVVNVEARRRREARAVVPAETVATFVKALLTSVAANMPESDEGKAALSQIYAEARLLITGSKVPALEHGS